MMARHALEVLHVGSASRDLTSDDPRGWRLGGGVTYAALTTARLGLRTAAVVGERLRVRDVPASWREARAWSIVPVAGEIDDSWAAVVPPDAYLALGWQGFLRDLTPGQQVTRRPPGPSALLERADLVGVSHHDVGPGTSVATLTGLLHPGADLLVTEGDLGGLLIRVGEDGQRQAFRYLPTATDRETD